MEKTTTKNRTCSFEKKSALILSICFIAVLASAWIYSVQLRKTITEKQSAGSKDIRAVVEVEKLRNLAQSQLQNSLSFLLLGSSTLFDEQKKEKELFEQNLVAFEKKFSLPAVPPLVKHLQALQQQRQEFFDQAMDFRAKQTESKIVGQFYRSKIIPLRIGMDKAFDEIEQLHQVEYERTSAQAKEAASYADVQIPGAMIVLITAVGALFIGMIFLVLRLLAYRGRQTAEQNRLYAETQKAILSRDEALSSIAEDFKEPLGMIVQSAEALPGEKAEVIENAVALIEDRVHDILDQAKAEIGDLTLRLDQLGLDRVLDDARLMMQPMAKLRDVRLEFNPVNPPVLAFMDRERVMRVLSNLIGNAIKFSRPMGKVSVKVRSDQQFVFVSIKDDGHGISEKNSAGLFERYWQAPRTAEQGAGVGLAVVKTIIEAHGGVVGVDSHLGSGTTFTFSLPRRRPAGIHLGKPAFATVRKVLRPESPVEIRDGRFEQI